MSGPEPRRGVSFDQWAFVIAGLGDGLSLGELLVHQEIPADRWEDADASFQEALLDDVEAGGALSQTLDEAMIAARSAWQRAIPPLDADLGAWVAYRRAWAEAADPMAFLREGGLRATDLVRLDRLWNDRVQADPALRTELVAILAAPPADAPRPAPEPLRLLPRDRPADGDSDLADPAEIAAAKAALPFIDAEAAPMHPPLSVPIPPPRAVARRVGIDETSLASEIAQFAAEMPFVRPAAARAASDDAAPPAQTETIAEPAALPPPPLPSPPVELPPKVAALAGTSLDVEIPFRPALPFLKGVAATLPASPDPAPREVSAPRLGATADIVSPKVDAPALPFSAPAPAAPSPPAAAQLTMEQYASLHVDLARSPAQAAETLRRYGLTKDQKAKLDAEWSDRMARDPSVWLAFEGACNAYRAWLKKGG